MMFRPQHGSGTGKSKDSNISITTSPSNDRMKYLSLQSETFLTSKNSRHQKSLSPWNLWTKPAQTFSGARPYRKCQSTRIQKTIWRRWACQLYQPTYDRALRVPPWVERPNYLDHRPKWQNHAVGFKESDRSACKDHPQSTNLFPRCPLSVWHALFSLVFVNTPMLFDTIWNKLLPSIHPHTQEKILMVGDEL